LAQRTAGGGGLLVLGVDAARTGAYVWRFAP
jgi:hypothetical protein